MNPGQTRRRLALASIYDGAARTEGAPVGGVTLKIVSELVLKLNSHGLIDCKGGGALSTDIFGAICPITEEAAGLVRPWSNKEAMDLQLLEVSARVTPGKHCGWLADLAGWPLSKHLAVPSTITIVKLPA